MQISKNKSHIENRILSYIGLILAAIGLGVGGGLLTVMLPNPLLGFGLVAALILVIAMIAKPLFSFMIMIAVCCLLPFGNVPIKAGFLTLTILEATLLLLFGICFLRLAISNRTGEGELVTTPLDGAILLFVGLSLFSYALNWQNASGTDFLHQHAKLILAILQFFVVTNLIRTQANLNLLLKTIMIAGATAGYLGAGLTRLPRDLQESLLGRLQILGYPTERILRFVEDDEVAKPQRATGTSVDPNSFGGMLVLIVALLVTQLASAKPLLPRPILALLLPGPTIALYLTQGRGAQLGALMVIAFVATLKYRRIWLYSVPFIILGAIILPSTFLGTRLAQGFALEDPATIMRLNEYQNALTIIGQYPLFGVGFGNAPTIELTVGASMIYLMIGEQMGLIGLAAFGLVVLLFFWHALSQLNQMSDPQKQANLLGLTAGVIGALAVGCLDHYFFNGEFAHMVTLLWLYIGLAVVQIRLGKSNE